MKQLELELKKRLLIVEVPEEKLFSEEKQIKAVINSQKYVNELLGEVIDLTFICKGSELTEEIAEELVKNGISDYLVEWAYDYKNEEQLNLYTFSCLESFISAIVAQGYYWGENPIEKPPKNDLNGSFFTMQTNFHQEKAYDEAGSKTFNPEKTLIFEIL